MLLAPACVNSIQAYLLGLRIEKQNSSLQFSNQIKRRLEQMKKHASTFRREESPDRSWKRRGPQLVCEILEKYEIVGSEHQKSSTKQRPDETSAK